MAKSRKRDNSVPVLDREQPESLTPNAGAPQAAGDTTVGDADRDRVAARAYELYMSRGGNDGADLDDWLQAEREVSPRERRGSEDSDRGE